MENNKELKDEELEKVNGGMKIILISQLEKIKKYILDILNKTKRKKQQQ